MNPCTESTFTDNLPAAGADLAASTYTVESLDLVSDSPDEIARDVLAVGQLDSVPTLLEVLCETTGMGFAAVARVTEKTWTVCAVVDQIDFGLKPGGQLELESTLCIEAKRARSAIVIDHASQDQRYSNHHTPRIYKIESYVSVPIVFGNGRYFGNLCAIDPRPAKVMDPKVVGMFQRFAALIASQLESQLKFQRNETELRDARASSELREQFIAILGHDLRNPLQAVAATSALLERKYADPAIKGMAARITGSVNRMSRLIDDILDFARSRLGGGIGVSIDEGRDVDSALSQCVRELQDAHPDREIATDIKVTRVIRCDIARLQQVTSNLLGNALTHGAPDRPIAVVAYTDDSAFVLEVSNDGEPIPADSLPKIFEPFWRQSIGHHRQGLGLGLSICSQIVRAHRGSLSVTSSKELGTTFTVRLPL
jgi:signal transduction histidine kinase